MFVITVSIFPAVNNTTEYMTFIENNMKAINLRQNTYNISAPSAS